MGRQLRDLTRSEWYHVYNRGADRQDIFSADRDRVLFEELMGEALPRFDVSLHAYALMTNHFHLLAHAPNGGLSEAMQRLCGRYGAAYNDRVERTGSLLTGRFCSVPITSDEHLIWSARAPARTRGNDVRRHRTRGVRGRWSSGFGPVTHRVDAHARDHPRR